MIKINEIFYSLQGEGRFVGQPSLFIRLSGCTRRCGFCDTSFDDFKVYTIEEVVSMITHFEDDKDNIHIIWTGGEPLLQLEQISEIIKKCGSGYFHCLETNGDLIYKKMIIEYLELFNYISISPKDMDITIKIHNLFCEISDVFINYDIKIVSDGDILGIGHPSIAYATMLMPLTTFDEEKDKIIKGKVWEMCKTLKKRYSPRIHVDIFGNKKGV